MIDTNQLFRSLISKASKTIYSFIKFHDFLHMRTCACYICLFQIHTCVYNQANSRPKGNKILRGHRIFLRKSYDD